MPSSNNTNEQHSRGSVVLHPEFAARLNAVADSNPQIPPHNYGRLNWFSTEFAKRGEEVGPEMVRKYFAGENKPRQKRVSVLAEILGVDESWLLLGKSADVQSKRATVRNAQVSGVVNVVAGLIEMHGGSPAFPEEGDGRAAREYVDIYAIIRGAQYAMHIALAERVDDGYLFHLPPGMSENTLNLGVIQKSPLCFELVELDADGVREVGKRGKGSTEILLDADFRTGDHQWQRIETFSKRL